MTIRGRLAALLGVLALGACPRAAAAEDMASVVARARDQVERGAYDEAMATLARLPEQGVPQALAIEAGLLETTAAIVTRGPGAGEAACARAVVAAGYDPEVAREQSPKVRAACRAAAARERQRRLAREGVTLGGLEVHRPEVAWEPVQIAATAGAAPMPPAWLRVVARVTSSALGGSFDLPLAPSLEGPLRGTLDASWIRPGSRIRVELVAQDRFGDLGAARQEAEIAVPAAEAMVALGEVPRTATVTIDGAPAALGPGGSAPVTPGRHRIAIRLENGAAARASVDVQRGGVAKVSLTPTRPASERVWPWVATGATLALAAAGSVCLFVAARRTSEIEELAARREPDTGLPATQYADIAPHESERRAFVTAGAVLLTGAGAAGIASAVLWLAPESRRKRPVPRVRPVAAPGWVGVTGTF